MPGMRVLLFTMLFTMLTLDPASAMPPRPGTQGFPSKGGIVDVKVRRITELRPSSTTAPPPRTALRGKHRVLVVLVATQDSPWPVGYDAGRFQEILFDRSTASLAEYYRENSYGLFEITGQVVGPVVIPGRLDDFRYERGDTGERVKVLVSSALETAGRQVDLKSFDTHDVHGNEAKDGILDHLIVVYAERTGKADGFSPIWPHRGTTDIEIGGLRVNAYIAINHAAPLGVFAHEFGHDIGIPDLYDRDSSSHGAGDWCVMASGSWIEGGGRPSHISAWGKIRMGWISPEIIAKPVQSLKIPASSEKAFALKIPIGEIDSQEYFLLENRRRVGFDDKIPAEGLLIWHIDEEKGDNDDETRKMVDVIEGSRVQDLDRAQESTSPNYGPDVFVGGGRDRLDDQTDPSARSNRGAPSGIRISVHTPAERVMLVDIDRPAIFNPGGVPYTMSRDGWSFGRFFTVPLGAGSESLMRLQVTPGGYMAFGAEVFFSGSPGATARSTLRIYEDQRGKTGKVLATRALVVHVGAEGHAWVRTRLSDEKTGLKLRPDTTVWVGVTSDDGKASPALNPASVSKEARWRGPGDKELADHFRFKGQGKTQVADYVIRVAGFGYLDGYDLPEPRANDADELVKRLLRADEKADKNRYEEALTEYEAILAEMEQSPRRYETWIPVATNSIGVVAYELKRYDVARERFEVSLRRAQAAEDQESVADIYENLGETSFFARKLADASTYCDRARELNRRLKRADRLVENLYWLGRSKQELEDFEGGKAKLLEARAMAERAFAKEQSELAEWKRKIDLAIGGAPEDRASVAERSEELKKDPSKGRHKAKYTDLLQFLADDVEKPSGK